MDNSGAVPLHVPGINGLPIDFELPTLHRFTHGVAEWAQVPAITLRELTITSVINKITDKSNWYRDVFDSEIVWRWYNELILSTPLLSETTWQWCMDELNYKARIFEERGSVRVLDTGSCVCKSDGEEVQGLAAEVQAGMEPLQQEREHECSSGSVHTYIDPSRHPLIYGKTHALTRGGYVPRDANISADQASNAEQIPAPINDHVDVDGVQRRIESGIDIHDPWSRAFLNLGWQDIHKYYWSYKYQWLPSDVYFTEPSSTNVRLMSPVNGISPDNKLLHRALEKIISLMIEPWNECLIKGQDGWKDGIVQVDGGWAPANGEWRQRGRIPCRIITYGVEWENEAPYWFHVFDRVRRKGVERYQKALAAIEDIKREKPPRDADRKTRMKHKMRVFQAEDTAKRWEDVKGTEQLPEPTPELWQRAHDYLTQSEPGLTQPTPLPDDWQADTYRLLRAKLTRMLHPKHPEPSTAFTYTSWRDNLHAGTAIVPMVTHRPINPSSTPPSTPHTPYTITLQDAFRAKGLQVITRISSIHLTPRTSTYPGTSWTLAGQKNEHIVATGIYIYAHSNTSPPRLALRQQTNISPGFFRHGPHLFQPPEGYTLYKQPAHELGKGSQMEAISEIFGFDPLQMCSDRHDFALPLQDVGTVTLTLGRLVAFPNVMESRWEGLELVDGMREGYVRWVEVMLVDPNYRICSTGNVVPMQEVDGKEEEKVAKEMEDERERARWARYAMMGTFFFC